MTINGYKVETPAGMMFYDTHEEANKMFNVIKREKPEYANLIMVVGFPYFCDNTVKTYKRRS